MPGSVGWRRLWCCFAAKIAVAESVIRFEQAYLAGKRATIPEQFRGPKGRHKAMSKTSKKTATADKIADLASRGEDISAYFTKRFTVVRPVRRVKLDLREGLLRELDHFAARLKPGRQAARRRAG